MLPQDVASTGKVIAQAWDPYDVWFKRVKLPRERHAQRALAVAGVQPGAANEAPPKGSSTDDPLMGPGVF